MTSRGKAAALSLYRGILRAHKRMPTEMRILGDKYVRSEFKLHKPVTNEAQLEAFFKGWEEYLEQVSRSARRKESVDTGALETKDRQVRTGYGQDLPLDIELSDEQKSQLDKLREETTRGGK